MKYPTLTLMIINNNIVSYKYYLGMMILPSLLPCLHCNPSRMSKCDNVINRKFPKIASKLKVSFTFTCMFTHKQA